jgi:hypothetical protein
MVPFVLRSGAFLAGTLSNSGASTQMTRLPKMAAYRRRFKSCILDYLDQRLSPGGEKHTGGYKVFGRE